MKRDWWKATHDPKDVLPVPWMHPAAVAYLDTLLRPEMSVLEQGCGGSTIWFSSRVAKVISVENDEHWLNYIRSWVGRNVEFRLDYPYPTRELADLLLIDGKPNTARIPWICVAEKLVKPGGIVVLDNSDETDYADWKHELDQKMVSWVTIHPSFPKKGFDTTFYRMPGGTETWI